MLTPAQRLKLQLLTGGVSVTPAAREALSGAGGTLPLTLADYASTSGIALELHRDIWVNAPIRDFNPNFVGDSPHCLDLSGSGFIVRSGALEVRANPLPVPAFASQTDPEGRPYSSYGITHTDRIRISPIEGCPGRCKFCDLTVKYAYRTKPVEGLVKTVALALNDPVLPAKHVMISGGAPRLEDFTYLNDAYHAIVTRFPSVPVDIMMLPLPGLLDLQALFDLGVNALAINLELYDEEIARSLMPLKGSMSRRYWLDFLERAAEVFGPGRVRSLLMVGLEPLEQTLRGVEALAQRGCEPVLSPFRPDPSTELKDRPPPTAGLLAEAYERSVEIAGRYGQKLGPRCIPCHHNTVTFPDGSDYYLRYSEDE